MTPIIDYQKNIEELTLGDAIGMADVVFVRLKHGTEETLRFEISKIDAFKGLVTLEDAHTSIDLSKLVAELSDCGDGDGDVTARWSHPKTKTHLARATFWGKQRDRQIYDFLHLVFGEPL